MDLRSEIEKFVPFNEQEECDKELFLNYIDTFSDVLTRDNKMCHFTSTGWIVNEDRTKVLMIYHNIYDSWAWVGGHADGDSNLLRVAKKEIEEETGISDVKLLSDGIYSIGVITVDPHIKRGKFVSSHVHLDCCYLFEAKESDLLRIKEDENSGVKWVNINEVVNLSKENKMKPIYQKLIDKMRNIK